MLEPNRPATHFLIIGSIDHDGRLSIYACLTKKRYREELEDFYSEGEMARGFLARQYLYAVKVEPAGIGRPYCALHEISTSVRTVTTDTTTAHEFVHAIRDALGYALFVCGMSMRLSAQTARQAGSVIFAAIPTTSIFIRQKMTRTGHARKEASVSSKARIETSANRRC